MSNCNSIKLGDMTIQALKPSIFALCQKWVRSVNRAVPTQVNNHGFICSVILFY